MANKIQLKRGLKSKLPTLSQGEPAYTTDTREFFIGTGSGNVNIGGSHWYTGTAMSGTSTTTGAYSYSTCPQVKVGDIYLNTSNGNVYECTTAGSGTTAKWTYKGSIRGGTGPQGIQGAAGKDAGTYVVTTTAELNAAVTALNSTTTGGKIILREGNYTLSTQIRECILFEGMTPAATSITHLGLFSSSEMTNEGENLYISFKNLSLTLQTSETGHDGAILTFDNCWITNGSASAYSDIFIGNGQDIYFNNCRCVFTFDRGTSLSTLMTCASVMYYVRAHFNNCDIDICSYDNRKSLVYKGDVIMHSSRCGMDSMDEYGLTCLAAGRIEIDNSTIEITNTHSQSISHECEFSAGGRVVNSFISIRMSTKNTNFRIAADVVSGNTFSSPNAFSFALPYSTIFSNNKFIGSGTPTIIGDDKKQIITNNLLKTDLNYKSCAAGSITSNNIVF